MSTHVTSIISGIKTTVAAELGADFSELPFVQDLTKNNKRTARYGYGVRPLDANTADGGVVRAYTLDHRFEVVLTESFVNRSSDAEIEACLGRLYDKADEVFKELVNSKAGVPDVVLSVSEPSMTQPEVIEAAKIVAIRLQLKVKYRSTI